MDLTSLSSNLPRNNSATEDLIEDEEPSSTVLMSAFKQAAVSVTTLYKVAGEQVERARRDGHKEGYQECLDDLFSLMTRLEGKTDPPTREIFKQWALGKRRKLGTRPTRREEREPSSDSDIADRQRSSSPVQPAQQEPEQQVEPEPIQQMQMSPPSPKAQPSPHAYTLPRLPTFNFQAGIHMPRHPPSQSGISDFELPDNNDSPPPSPVIAPQQNMFQHNSFQQTKTFGAMNANNSRGRNSRSRTGNKRRFESINDFFDLAGMEKMQHMGKKGRFQ